MSELDLIFNKLKNIINTEINLIDQSGYILQSTNSEKIGGYDSQLCDIKLENEIVEKGNYLYFCFYEYKRKVIVSIKILDKITKKIGEVIRFFLTINFDNMSKDGYIKHLLLGKIDNHEIESLNENFDVDFNNQIQVVVIKVNKDISDDVENLLLHFYPDELFVKVNNSCFAFIKSLKDDCKEYELSIFEVISSELFYEPKIGVGTIVDNIKDLAISYKKANMAIEIGNVLDNQRYIFYYKNLGLALLINNMNSNDLEQLNKDLNYNIEEVVSDKELLSTATIFLENNLNISETAKRLYIHRNTLVYRLNKIQRLTGYNLGKFEDSINFKIALDINKLFESIYNKINYTIDS